MYILGLGRNLATDRLIKLTITISLMTILRSSLCLYFFYRKRLGRLEGLSVICIGIVPCL